jgi:recombining binding protein suppressor of hairless
LLAAGPQTVTYGSQIVLTDTLSGISTGSLIIRKVDKGIVTLEDGGPVSQMQKIALQRIGLDGARQYLSAAGSINATGSGGTQKMASSSQSGTHALTFQSPRSREEVKDGIRRVVDEVDDYLCWTIVGICAIQFI